ncbi:MAG: hypothetical protein KU37_03220 [Sulfuricurvum sp. PC08-66]|nr:MAG: hypothetical protein KU37_03220 [Sulfuricurvum sp. PC08-66]
MKQGSAFGLHGITGALIATVLLVSILVGLTIWGLLVQQDTANDFYKLENPSEIKMISTENGKHLVDGNIKAK